MRILILSFYFAPQNTMAAHRLTRLAAYLREQGHEVRVISARAPDVPTDPETGAADITDSAGAQTILDAIRKR